MTNFSATTAAAEFVATSDSRETSREIMQSIAWLARDGDDAVRIWAEPTDAEMLAIWERVTDNGLRPSDDYCWGEWADSWGDAFLD